MDKETLKTPRQIKAERIKGLEDIAKQLVAVIENPHDNDLVNFARFVAIAVLAKNVLRPQNTEPVFTGYKDKNGNEIMSNSHVKEWIVDEVEPGGGFWWYGEIRIDADGDAYRVYQIGYKYEQDDEALLLSETHHEIEIIK